jgi:hypothetical protein
MRATLRTALLTLAAIIAAGTGAIARAQVGQPTAGLINQGSTRLGVFTGEGPGWFYYGVNAADRGLGYNGSYMTVGGFVPYSEDDLGGLWAADVRGHFSVNGGFFSNVGAVRKQFIGGTLLGVGVYWDYDGDMDQYPTAGVPGTDEFGQFGHTYNQVGVSGEWLTDFGNLRSNGYIPVGPTANTLGAPGSSFTGNYILCQNGLDAALGGADLEVGAYIPGLTDWAGMVSVGGYALGNSRYEWTEGSDLGDAVVPWFGGVYTRLDMTFVQNWDFSLQANNDSYFDWTGYARLTYRMGGSRRRNVPDQMEQPMMRNEHIVRAHQTPLVATNPVTSAAWNVIHVDNTAEVGGDGTAEAPVRTVAFGQGLALSPYDVVFVHTGDSATTPYDSAVQFQADNQLLVGEGSSLQLNTVACGYQMFFNGTGDTRPVLTSTSTAIELRNGALVDHLRIQSAPIAISADPTVTGTANVNDVELVGTGVVGDAGIILTGLPAGAEVNLYNMTVQNMDLGLFVDGGEANITFQGLITNTNSAERSVDVLGTTGGTININTTTDTLQTPVARDDRFFVSYGIVDANSQSSAPVSVTFLTDTIVNIGQARIVSPSDLGVLVGGNIGSEVTFTNLRVTDSTNEAFLSQASDATSFVTITGASELSSVSTTLPAFGSNDDATLNIDLVSLESAVTSGTNNAIVLQGTSTGFFTITEDFLVANPAPPPATIPGTVAADVTNGTGVIVTVPP